MRKYSSILLLIAVVLFTVAAARVRTNDFFGTTTFKLAAGETFTIVGENNQQLFLVSSTGIVIGGGNGGVIPTQTGILTGYDAPSPETCQSGSVGSIYLRNNQASASPIAYICAIYQGVGGAPSYEWTEIHRNGWFIQP